MRRNSANACLIMKLWLMEGAVINVVNITQFLNMVLTTVSPVASLANSSKASAFGHALIEINSILSVTYRGYVVKTSPNMIKFIGLINLNATKVVKMIEI